MATLTLFGCRSSVRWQLFWRGCTLVTAAAVIFNVLSVYHPWLPYAPIVSPMVERHSVHPTRWIRHDNVRQLDGRPR